MTAGAHMSNVLMAGYEV